MRFCPFVERTVLVLEHKRIPYEAVFVNLKNKPDWLFERNPFGLVPIVEYKGHVIYESAVCDEYLEEAFPASTENGTALLPACPFGRAAARLLMLAFDKTTGTFFSLLKASDLTNRQEALDSFQSSLEKFEKILATSSKPFFGGANCGMIDFHMWPFFERFDAVSEIANVDILPAAKFPQLTVWMTSMGMVDAVRKTRLSTKNLKRFLLSYRDNNPDYDFELENA
jgi:glutathione S-transferase